MKINDAILLFIYEYYRVIPRELDSACFLHVARCHASALLMEHQQLTTLQGVFEAVQRRVLNEFVAILLMCLVPEVVRPARLGSEPPVRTKR